MYFSFFMKYVHSYKAEAAAVGGVGARHAAKTRLLTVVLDCDGVQSPFFAGHDFPRGVRSV